MTTPDVSDENRPRARGGNGLLRALLVVALLVALGVAAVLVFPWIVYVSG